MLPWCRHTHVQKKKRKKKTPLHNLWHRCMYGLTRWTLAGLFLSYLQDRARGKGGPRVTRSSSRRGFSPCLPVALTRNPSWVRLLTIHADMQTQPLTSGYQQRKQVLANSFVDGFTALQKNWSVAVWNKLTVTPDQERSTYLFISNLSPVILWWQILPL